MQPYFVVLAQTYIFTDCWTEKSIRLELTNGSPLNYTIYFSLQKHTYTLIFVIYKG